MKEKPNPDSFSYRLRQLRKKQNLTQQGLANKLNVHVTTVIGRIAIAYQILITYVSSPMRFM